MNKSLFKIIIPLGIVFAFLLLFMPRDSKFPYEYKKGRVWKYESLFADFDFPIYKTSEQMREERLSNHSDDAVPYYKFSDEVLDKTLRSVKSIGLGPIENTVVSEIRQIYGRGVIADETRRGFHDLDEHQVIYIQRDKRAYRTPVSDIYRLSDARSKLEAALGRRTNMDVDSLLRETGMLKLIVPNVIYDQQTTELVHSESNTEISPTSGYVTAGQLVVSEGEIVTAEIEQMLDSYKREYEENIGYIGPPVLLFIGSFFIALAFVVLLYLVIKFSCPAIFGDTRYHYVLLVYVLAATAAFIVGDTKQDFLIFLPFTLFALMLQAFFPIKESLAVYIVSLLPIFLVSDDGSVLYFMFMLAGLVHIYVFKYFQKGWKQFISALITFGVLLVLYLAFTAADLMAGNIWRDILGLFVGSMLTVAAYPLVYLFERMFNLVSNSRLLELSDMSNPIVRLLEQKAPGTFQHSLQVMNMGDAVARAVGVNPDLVRVGALYHDIGKIENPLCFVENEFLTNKHEENKYHSGLTPAQSAHDIIKHVEDGLELAKKSRMPQIVSDFISSHHGTTVVSYFYNKFLKEGGDPSMISDFTYKGKKPVTKAEIILMLCDSVEAASRTLSENSAKAYSDLVERIVAGKMDQGQFDDADVTISELNTVKATLKSYLAQLNHERIVYPKSKININK